jgi:membrane protease subunit HflC
MKQVSLIVLGLIIIGVILVVGGTFYVVNEAEQVVITQFGEPKGDPLMTPGLKVKIPFIQKANRFEKRFMEWDGETNQVPTKDKRFIYVDAYARWQITDPLRYFQRLRDELGAQSRLDDILDGETRNAVANHNLIEVVRSSNREFAAREAVGDDTVVEEFATVDIGRTGIVKEVLEAANSRCTDLGIVILDFRFKRINYVEQVRRDVYNRMISERQRIAEKFRSEGAGESARIAGEREKLLREITSDAYRQAQEIKGKADADAARIYAAAYNKDPEFYRFLKTMETYRVTMDKETLLLLSSDGEFLRYLGKSR